MNCNNCSGTGKIMTPCNTCRGTGLTDTSLIESIKISRGINTGNSLIAKGKVFYFD